MLTDNPVMLRRQKPLPALMCVQRRAEKVIPNEDILIHSNMNSFGSEIGKITNYVTSMYEVRSGFEPDSEEYKTLSYRIQSGQNAQQNAINNIVASAGNGR